MTRLSVAIFHLPTLSFIQLRQYSVEPKRLQWSAVSQSAPITQQSFPERLYVDSFLVITSSVRTMETHLNHGSLPVPDILSDEIFLMHDDQQGTNESDVVIVESLYEKQLWLYRGPESKGCCKYSSIKQRCKSIQALFWLSNTSSPSQENI